MSVIEIIGFLFPFYIILCAIIYKYALMLCIEDGFLEKGSWDNLKIPLIISSILFLFFLPYFFLEDLSRGIVRKRGIKGTMIKGS